MARRAKWQGNLSMYAAVQSPVRSWYVEVGAQEPSVFRTLRQSEMVLEFAKWTGELDLEPELPQ